MSLTGLQILTTVYIRNLLANNPGVYLFPLQYARANGTIAPFALRSELQAELDSRPLVQDLIWGLTPNPQNPT